MEKLSNKCPCNMQDCPHGGQCDYYCEKYATWVSQTRASLEAYENTGLTPEEIERILDAYGRRMTLRTESGQRLQIIRDIPTGRLRELVQEYQNGKIQPMSCAGCRYDQTFSLEEHNTHCMRCIRNRYPDDHYTGAEAEAALEKGAKHDGD